MKEYRKILEDKGISPSLQRMMIYGYIVNSQDHPTSEDIYQGLCDEIPTLSRTTVYNALKLFVRKGLVCKMSISGNEIRYEGKLGFHAHFRCNKCGRIYDIPYSRDDIKIEETDGHTVESIELILRGLCRDCGDD
jgi:Fur family transcriptional regulator, peroxide stress response regulator